MAEGQPDNAPSPEQPPEKILISLEEAGGQAFIASSQAEGYLAIDYHERRWLEALSLEPTGVNIQEVLTEADEPTISVYVAYSSARESLVNKVNSIFEREVLQITEVVDALLHVSSGLQLEVKEPLRRQTDRLPIYGHPSTIVHVGAAALQRVRGFKKGEAVPPVTQIMTASHVTDNLNRHPPSSGWGSFTKSNPLLSAAILEELQAVFPQVKRQDVDWMTQANCTNADPVLFNMRSKRALEYAKANHCGGCQVSQECHDFAVTHNIKGGIWGGADEKERKDKEFTANVARVMESVKSKLQDAFETRPQQIAREAARWLKIYLEDRQQSVLKEAQIPLIQSLLAHYELEHDNPDGFIVAPTGVGKTVLFIELIRSTGLKAIVLVHTQELLHQTVSAFSHFHEEGDVGKIYAHAKETDSHITVTTYQSFLQHVARQTGLFSLEDIDLLVLDEAHKSLGSRSYELISSLSHILKIGFTATDEYDQEKTLSNLLPHEIAKMETTESIDAGMNAPFQVIVVETDADFSEVSISPSTKDFDDKQRAKAVNTVSRNELVAQIYDLYYRGKKAVFFCADIAHAEEVAAQLREHGICAEAIHGKQTQNERQRILGGFNTPVAEGGLEVICNVKLLAEGWDNTAASVCFRLQPTLSKVRAKQEPGRVLRINPEDPDKVAAIVEFRDKNYKVPPIIFADPEVAKKATYFAGGLIPEDKLLLAEHARIISHPEEVEAIANEMSSERRRLNGLPPHDWLTWPKIIKTAIKKAGVKSTKNAKVLFDVYVSRGENSVFFQEIVAKHPGNSQIVRERSKPPEYAFSPEAAEDIIQELSIFFNSIYGDGVLHKQFT